MSLPPSVPVPARHLVFASKIDQCPKMEYKNVDLRCHYATDQVVPQIAAINQLEKGSSMNRGELDAWFASYNGTQAKKGADIFQDAWKDLILFLDLIEKFAQENPNQKLHFIQLGDCCDFWIGMQLGLKKGQISLPDKPVDLTYGGKKFAEFWYLWTPKRTNSDNWKSPDCRYCLPSK
jgi:hypothetical protein